MPMLAPSALVLLALWPQLARAAEPSALTPVTWGPSCVAHSWEDAETCYPEFTVAANPNLQARELAPADKSELASIAPAAGSTAGEDEGYDIGGVRPYFQLRVGRASYLDPNSPDIELENPSGEPVLGFSFGSNINRYLGVELAIDNVETNLNSPPPDQKAGEYSVWTGLLQARLRYPFHGIRLTPYLLFGAGAAYGEFNDRNVLLSESFTGSPEVTQVEGGSDTSFAATIGVGGEYFVAPNIALGLEARYLYVDDLKIAFAGGERSLNLDSVYYGATSRIYFDDGGEQNRRGPPADSDDFRVYAAVRAGIAFYTKTDGSNGVSIDQQGTQVGAFAIGANVNENWGFEFAADYSETEISVSGLGPVAEFAFWTMLIQARYRYPFMDGRLVPYAVAGGGLGFSQINDRFVTATVSALTGDTNTSKPVAALGVGLDYFLAENLAVTGEAKYVAPFPTDIAIDGVPVDLDLNPVFLSAGFRVLF